MEQLTFTLDEPITNLVPIAIKFNKDELIAGISEMVEPYNNAIYGEEQISELKEALARMRKLDAALDGARKDVQKAYNKPFDVFKADVEDVRNIVKQAINQLSAQADAYEQKRIDEKTELIKQCWAEVVGEYNDVISLDKVWDERWLNKTYDMKKVRKDMTDFISNVAQNLETIKMLKSPDELVLLSLYFRTLSLDSALRENERLKAEREQARIFAEREQAKAKVAQEAAQAVIEPTTVIDEQAAVNEEEQQATAGMTVVLRFVDMTEAQARDLLSYIKSRGLKFKRIKE